MNKLPATSLSNLKSALASGSIPDFGQPGYDDLFDVWDELGMSLAEDWANAKASPARREVSALTDLHNSIAPDGVLVGVICNQAPVVAPAIAAAASMRLPAVAELLKELAGHIPATILEMDDPEDRLNWYDSPEGVEHSEALEDLEERLQHERIVTDLMLACCRRVINESAEFFE